MTDTNTVHGGAVDLHAIAKDAAERVHKNGGCVPQLAFAPILWALQDAFPPQTDTDAREKVVEEVIREALEFYADGFDWHPGDGEPPDATHPGSPPTFYEAEARPDLIEDAGQRARQALAALKTGDA